MEKLHWFAQRAGAALICLALAGCASGPVAVEPAPEKHWRSADVYSIPAQAWIEQNHEAVGLTPVRIWVETYSNGVPKRPVVLRAHDKASGAWEQKVIATVPMPSRIVFDLRPWLPAPVMIR
jgi:hypothetical protein